jgi:hypothetical protein
MLTKEQEKALKEQAKRTADKYIADPSAIGRKRWIDDANRRRADQYFKRRGLDYCDIVGDDL